MSVAGFSRLVFVTIKISPSNIMIFIRFIKEHWGLSAIIIIQKTL